MRSHMRKPLGMLVVGLLGGGIVAMIVAGCATIMHGTQQSLGIGSTPTGATVMVDKQAQGKTPLVAKLSRKDIHTIRIEMEGYQPFETTLQRKVDGWVWGNIVFGGLIGLAVDAISGGMYKLTPAQVEAALKQQAVGVRVENDMLLIAVTLKADPGWEKIGQLTPAGE